MPDPAAPAAPAAADTDLPGPAVSEPTTYTLREAKARLSELIRRATAGETITITRDGVPAVEMMKAKATTPPTPIFTGAAQTNERQKRIDAILKGSRRGDRDR